MTKSFSLLLAYLLVPQVYAQVTVELKEGVSHGDTLRVEVIIGEHGVALSTPISSFQFEVAQKDSAYSFIGLVSDWTLTDKNGWTTRANLENGRVGGFSSSLDAVQEGGVLTVLLFKRPENCSSSSFQLDIFRLNARNPPHSPASPEFIFPPCND